MKRPIHGVLMPALVATAGMALGALALARSAGESPDLDPAAAAVATVGFVQVAADTPPAVRIPPVPFRAENGRKFVVTYAREADYPANPSVVGNQALFFKSSDTGLPQIYSFQVLQARRGSDPKLLIVTLKVRKPGAGGAAGPAGPVVEPAVDPALLGKGSLIITLAEGGEEIPQAIDVIGIDEDPCDP